MGSQAPLGGAVDSTVADAIAAGLAVIDPEMDIGVAELKVLNLVGSRLPRMLRAVQPPSFGMAAKSGRRLNLRFWSFETSRSSIAKE